jgi:predicted ATP-grasp superfamily ATP-dependent carboligase
MSGPSFRAPAMHSKYVSRKVTSPSFSDGDAWLEWLLRVGRETPGLVLYPTCDDLAWRLAASADLLRPNFKTWAPRVEVYEALLDKATLHAACAKVGLETPATATSVEGARDIPMPVLIKQRTQVLSRTNDKGVLVHDRAKLGSEFEAFRLRNRHAPEVLARMPLASEPLIQQYFAEGVSGSLQVSGFIDETGELFVARAAKKLLQRPKTLGISLCLEAAPLDPELAAKVKALCLEVGYFGVFGIEFLQVDGRALLIDFNPRYYHFMALDIARGMPLPLMTFHAATENREALRAVVEASQWEPGDAATGFTYALQLNELLVAQTLTGTMALRESKSWFDWTRSHRRTLVDAVNDPSDRGPMLVDLATAVTARVRHPRQFIRRIAFDR